MAPTDLKPFTLAVHDSVLSDLRQRLASTRWPDQLVGDNDNWEYGTELGYLKSLAVYWGTAFDWRKQEELFNQMPQFTATVRGSALHFVHKRCTGSEQNPPALLICHGWPGSVFEFWKVLDKLAEEFHVVAPSMPGYGFSEAPRSRGFNVLEVARSFHALMLDLGYADYVAQGGDWGSMTAQSLGRLFPQHCTAIHINMPTAGPPEGFDMLQLSPQEAEGLRQSKAFQDHGTGYQKIQSTRPQTLSYGLNDSPVGLLAWIVEKFRDWSDCNGNVESVFTRDELLTNVMIYWVSGSIGSSMRLYYEQFAVMPGTSREPAELSKTKVTVPTGVAMFPKEIYCVPKSWCEHTYNLQHYSTFDRGGHFAALERPEELVQDIKTFFLGTLGLGSRRWKMRV